METRQEIRFLFLVLTKYNVSDCTEQSTGHSNRAAWGAITLIKLLFLPKPETLLRYQTVNKKVSVSNSYSKFSSTLELSDNA